MSDKRQSSKSRLPYELEVRVVMAAMSLYECEEALERVRDAPQSCSGPERHYMTERLRHIEELKKACETLKREKPDQWDRDFILKSARAT